MKKTAYTLVSVVISAFLYATVLTLFLIPAGLLTGGGGGLALTVNHYTNIPVSLASLAINVLMLIVGFVALGKEFAMTTLASTFLFPAMLEVCQRLFGGIVLTTDLGLCTLFSWYRYRHGYRHSYRNIHWRYGHSSYGIEKIFPHPHGCQHVFL